MTNHILGAHMPIGGGLDKALIRGHDFGCQAIQIFSKNSNQWRGRKWSTEEVDLFFETQQKVTVNTVVIHASYLINLGTSDSQLQHRSRVAMLDEIERAETLKTPYLILHPGSNKDGADIAIKNIVENLNWVLENTQDFKVSILLETTAGQGNSVGHTFEQLDQMIKGTNNHPRIGVCYDTCHTFVAGYDIRTKETYKKTFADFENIIGLEKLKTFHMNDTKKDIGSRVDRHEHIGKGFMGIEPFRMLLNDPRFYGIPMILETPKSHDLAEDKINLDLLKSLI